MIGPLIFIIICVGVGAIFYSMIVERKKQEEKAKRMELQIIQRNKEKQDQLKRYQDERQIMKDEYGSDPDKTISILPNSVGDEINVFESHKKVIIMGKPYSFSDILSCSVSDNARTIKGKMTSETKSNNWNAVGRTIVGDIVAGPVGAIVGGSTGKKQTVYNQDEDIIIHDYTVNINVNSISNPIIHIHTKRNENLTNEISGLMNVIISRNKRTS